MLLTEPESVDLLIDGQNDKCSKGEDINFQFTGFGVVGKVNLFFMFSNYRSRWQGELVYYDQI